MLVTLAACALAQDPRQIVQEAQRRAYAKSQRYEGNLKVIGASERVTEKRWQYDRIGSFGDSKTVLRFIDPPEVKGVALLVINYKNRASDQWMWTPALQRERRIALQDRSTRFFGTDFSFEDLEEREAEHFDFRLLGEEKLDGHDCWKLESRPRPTRTSQYTRSHLWIRKDVHAYVRVDAFQKDTLFRRILYRDLQELEGIWTARQIEVFDAKRNSRTVLKLDKVDYNIAVKEEDFTLQALRRGL